ncbi:MAG: carboxymuconolactone decarboxylase family protein [Actinomycetota bacterium]|jgi:4-carboxymuconolactone decarboxylase|nr:carboxymuconolactone decarboxylase family protein [Actinomycetota bacterium]
MTSEQYDTGLRIRKEVLGEEYVERALSSADAFNEDFQTFVTEYCWGAGWGRDGLERKQRSLLNLAMLSALNRPAEFKIHLRGALTNGCSLDEIRDTLIQVAIYCGIPAGVEAFRLAREVFGEDGVDVS